MNFENKKGENITLSDEWTKAVKGVEENRKNKREQVNRSIGGRELDKIKVDLQQMEEGFEERLGGKEKESVIGIFIRLIKYIKEIEGNRQSAEFFLTKMKKDYPFLEQINNT